MLIKLFETESVLSFGKNTVCYFNPDNDKESIIRRQFKKLILAPQIREKILYTDKRYYKIIVYAEDERFSTTKSVSHLTFQIFIQRGEKLSFLICENETLSTAKNAILHILWQSELINEVLNIPFRLRIQGFIQILTNLNNEISLIEPHGIYCLLNLKLSNQCRNQEDISQLCVEKNNILCYQLIQLYQIQDFTCQIEQCVQIGLIAFIQNKQTTFNKLSNQ